ncbi:hypothetical protein B0T18DRAFT_229857 [Schizothecium vesticola]|uniref:Uncharacterized protein n=1 Tax=Schizothecium vesticola TaxID=314040 RepID=A0AA40K0I9_9PEZI|nr:hypothetical protein B0T18DRAFT_229857 [Schizothecium vesticola]
MLKSLPILLKAVDSVWHRHRRWNECPMSETRSDDALAGQRQSSERTNRRGSMPSEPSKPEATPMVPHTWPPPTVLPVEAFGQMDKLGGSSPWWWAEGSGGLAVAAAATSTRPHACATMRTGGDGVDGNAQGEIGSARCRPWWRASRAHFPAGPQPAEGVLVLLRRDSCLVETPDRGGHDGCHASCLSGSISHVVDCHCFADRRRQSGVVPEMMVMGGVPPKQHWRSVGPGTVD